VTRGADKVVKTDYDPDARQRCKGGAGTSKVAEKYPYGLRANSGVPNETTCNTKGHALHECKPKPVSGVRVSAVADEVW